MTADPAGWPDPSRPGYPLHPERDGWHWLLTAHGISEPFPKAWHARIQRWELSDGSLEASHHAAERWTYLGPCILPADLAAERVAAAEAYRRGWLDRESDFMAGVERTGMVVTDESALAERDERMREEGRREEREACAKLTEARAEEVGNG